MGKDYYKILGVEKNAGDDDIKKAYRKAALKNHPDRAKGDKDVAKRKFQEIGEAFEVLSDKDKRQMYDAYGEEGLKGGVPPGAGAGDAGAGGFGGFPGGFSAGGGGGGARTFHFTTSSGGPGGAGGFSGFTPSDPEDVFSRFFQSMGGGGAGSTFFSMGGDEDAQMGGMPGGFQFSSGGSRGGASPFGQTRRTTRSTANGNRDGNHPVLTVPLKVSLDDIYKGATKKMKITRRIRDVSGRTIPTEKVLEVQIKPGWKAGTKITFPGEGDELPDGGYQDVQFVLGEKPHDTFTREGDTLKCKLELSALEALTGFSKQIQTLDGKRLPVSSSGPVQPGQEFRFPGQGMPISKTPGQRGDLVATAKITMPRLTPSQKQQVQQIFK